MKVFITGGSGFVGSSLTEALLRLGAEVTILTRRRRQGSEAGNGAAFLEGDPTRPGEWQVAAADSDVIVNMAGESIFQRWSKAVKQRIYDSRILTTRNVVEALLRSPSSGGCTLINTSAVGYYGFHGDEELKEDAPPGGDFLARLARDWEFEAGRAATAGVRVVICRFGVVLGSRGGALSEMLPLFRKGLGSPIGSGRQWVSWIHESDLVGIYLFALQQKGLAGVFNCTSPNPVTNRQMTEILAEALGKPSFMPAVPGFVLKLKLGEMAEVLTNGQKVLPGRLLEIGYDFRFPHLQDALRDLVS